MAPRDRSSRSVMSEGYISTKNQGPSASLAPPTVAVRDCEYSPAPSDSRSTGSQEANRANCGPANVSSFGASSIDSVETLGTHIEVTLLNALVEAQDRMHRIRRERDAGRLPEEVEKRARGGPRGKYSWLFACTSGAY